MFHPLVPTNVIDDDISPDCLVSSSKVGIPSITRRYGEAKESRVTYFGHCPFIYLKRRKITPNLQVSQ
jgi:hypothetical protein